MTNLSFSTPMKIKNIRDTRNSCMLDFEYSQSKIHYYYLTNVIDEETGEIKLDENNKPVLHIARADYNLGVERDYRAAISGEEGEEEEFMEDKYVVYPPKTEENPEPEPYDIISFNVKNFLTSPEELTKAYAFINVKGAEQPIFRYGADLNKSLMNIKKGELN